MIPYIPYEPLPLVDISKVLPYQWEDDSRFKEPEYILVASFGKAKIWVHAPPHQQEEEDHERPVPEDE